MENMDRQVLHNLWSACPLEFIISKIEPHCTVYQIQFICHIIYFKRKLSNTNSDSMTNFQDFFKLYVSLCKLKHRMLAILA